MKPHVILPLPPFNLYIQPLAWVTVLLFISLRTVYLLFQSPETFCTSLCFLHYLSVKSLPHTSQTRLGHLGIDFHATLHFLIHTTLVVICSKYTFTIQQVDPRRWGSSLSCPSLYPWPLAEYLTHSECAINIWGWMKNEWMEDWYDSYFWCWIMTIWA